MVEIPIIHDPEIESLTVALNYSCNSRCSFCFVGQELTLDLPDTPWSYLRAVFAKHVAVGRPYRRIIFSGAEATLRADLPDIARAALAEGGFELVQIQTNGRMLRRRALLDRLVEAGITEYFVSVHAPDAERDFAVTRAASAFTELRAGLANLREAPVRLISNTVVTAGTYRHLPDTARFLVDEGVAESEIWAFIEFGKIGQDAEYVPHEESAPYVRKAAELLVDAGRTVRISWFPECLLGPAAGLVQNHRATLLIDPSFGMRAASYGGFSCPHERECPRFGRSCQGLHQRYVEIHGTPASSLHPMEARSGG